MYIPRQFCGQRSVHRAVTGDQALPLKGVADQGDVKMRVEGAHGVAVAFVDDFQVDGGEGRRQFVLECVLH